MNLGTAALPVGAAPSGHTGTKRAFARHFVEMLLAMFLGMLVLGGVAQLAFVVSGGSLYDQSGGLRVMLMGVYMTLPMVLWMRYRGHAAARNVEMAASMMVPTIATAALAWAGTLDTAAAFGIQHVIMVPAMLGVMVWRYEHYSQPQA
jgi:hypothetical protein